MAWLAPYVVTKARTPVGRQRPGQPISTTVTGCVGGQRVDQLRAAGQPVQVPADQHDRAVPGQPAQRRRVGLAGDHADLLGAGEVRAEAPRHPALGDGGVGVQLHHQRLVQAR